MRDVRRSPRCMAARLAILVAIVVSAAGCGSRSTAPADPGPAPPALDTPAHVLVALAEGYERRDLALLTTLYPQDFVFVFSALDSAGNGFRNPPWARGQEIVFMEHLLAGGGARPPADSITFEFMNVLNDFPSSRPGHHPTWHREILAEFMARIRVGAESYEIRGPALFHFVRGDSATIPVDLAAQGVAPDSTRWWIERWEDHTIDAVAATRLRAERVQPVGGFTWGAFKVLYLENAPLAP